MSKPTQSPEGRVEPFPSPLPSTVVSDELSRLLELLVNEFPDASKIYFEFDGALHVHIDVHKGEEIAMVEARLPNLSGGSAANAPR